MIELKGNKEVYYRFHILKNMYNLLEKIGLEDYYRINKIYNKIDESYRPSYNTYKKLLRQMAKEGELKLIITTHWKMSMTTNGAKQLGKYKKIIDINIKILAEDLIKKKYLSES